MQNDFSQQDLKRLVLQGLCLKCFYSYFIEEIDSFACAKYNINLDGKVRTCPGFKPISEGLDELIVKMKAQGELPEWVGQ